MSAFLFQPTLFLAAAIVAVPLAARLGLGSVLGYLVAGIIIGPVFGVFGAHDAQELMHVAEFGVVMMLFLIGLELDPRALWSMRHRLVGLGTAQMGLTGAVVTMAAMALGVELGAALAIGMIFALSSTAIVMQTLSEKGLTQTSGGRSTFVVLLAQDVAVIPMLALLPLLAMPRLPNFAPDGSVQRHGLDGSGSDAAAHAVSMSLVEDLPRWGVTLVTIGMVAAVILAGIYLIRPFFRYIHSAKLREMHTASALLIVFGIAFAMSLVGLSPALGTFLAGVVLANSEFRHELESDIEPFKGLLLGLFFITVGAGIDFAVLFRAPLAILGMALGVMGIKALVLGMLGWVSGLRGRDLWLFTLGLAQAGEFGFVLVSFSLQQHVLTQSLGEVLLLVITMSILITPLFFILYERLSRRLARAAAPQHDSIDAQAPIIIAGIGRFGQVVYRLVRNAGFRTVILDHDLKTLELLRKFGIKGFLGDPTRPDLLRAAGLAQARVLVAAVDDPKAVVRLVKMARQARPDLHIVARARDRHHAYELYNAGANDIVRETFDSSLRAGRYVLENMGLDPYEAAEAEKIFFQHDRMTVRELARLWDPNLPPWKNRPYIERAWELEDELKTAILTQLERSNIAPDTPGFTDDAADDAAGPDEAQATARQEEAK